MVEAGSAVGHSVISQSDSSKYMFHEQVSSMNSVCEFSNGLQGCRDLQRVAEANITQEADSQHGCTCTVLSYTPVVCIRHGAGAQQETYRQHDRETMRAGPFHNTCYRCESTDCHYR